MDIFFHRTLWIFTQFSFSVGIRCGYFFSSYTVDIYTVFSRKRGSCRSHNPKSGYSHAWTGTTREGRIHGSQINMGIDIWWQWRNVRADGRGHPPVKRGTHVHDASKRHEHPTQQFKKGGLGNPPIDLPVFFLFAHSPCRAQPMPIGLAVPCRLLTPLLLAGGPTIRFLHGLFFPTRRGDVFLVGEHRVDVVLFGVWISEQQFFPPLVQAVDVPDYTLFPSTF